MHAVLIRIGFLIFVFSVSWRAPAQPLSKLAAEVKLDDKQTVVTDKLIEHDNQLLVITQNTLRTIDLATATASAPRVLDIPSFTEDRPRLISPDARLMLVFGNYGSRSKQDKVKRPPAVWDLQIGKQIKVFDSTAKPVWFAVWSQ